MIGSSQHRFMKGTCLSNLIVLHDEMTGSVNEGKTVNLVCLDFSKIFDIVYLKLLTG